jgi:hypothetical protein
MKNTTTTKRTNRFFARNIKRAALAPRSPRVAIAAPEIDALESRLLLSGIVAGKDYKKLSYTDFDGDKVTISMNKGTFQVNGVFDGNTVLSLDELKVTSGDSSAVLKVTVAKVKPTSDGIGVTNIGVIDTNNAALRGIQLDGASVDQTKAGGTALQFMTLQAKAAIQLDRNSAGGFGATEEVNFGTVTAKSLTLLQAANAPQSLVTNGQFLLNLNGPITVAEGTTSIVARTGAVNGAINVFNIGNLNVAGLPGGLTTQGDLTLNLADGATIKGATFTVGGNLHLSVLSGGLDDATFNVVGSISGGDNKSTTDAVAINGNLGKTDTVVFNSGLGGTGNIAGLTVSGGNVGDAVLNAANGKGDIGDISVTGGSAEFGNIAGNKIGSITASGDLVTKNITSETSVGAITGLSVEIGAVQAKAGDIGLISSTSKLSGGGLVDLNGNLTASGKITGITSTGNLDVDGNTIQGAEVGPISALEIKFGGNVKSTTGGIGDITASAGEIAVNITAGADATPAAGATPAQAATGGNIGKITAAGDVGNITAWNGSVGDITVTGGGDVASVIAGSANNSNAAGFAATGGTIGKITLTGTATNSSVLGAVTAHNAGIGEITINTNGRISGNITSGSGVVVIGSKTLAATGGDIGAIIVTDASQGTAAISGNIETFKGKVTSVSATDAGAGDVALTGNVTATTSIGDIMAKGTGLGSKGVNGGAQVFVAPAIGNITVLGTATAAGNDAQAAGSAITIGSVAKDTGTTTVGDITITGNIAGAAAGTTNLTIQGRGEVTTGTNAGVSVGTIVMNANAVSLDNLTVQLTDANSAKNVTLVGGSGTLTVDSNQGAGANKVDLVSLGNLTSSNILDLTGIANLKASSGVLGNIQAIQVVLDGNALQEAKTVGNITVNSFKDNGTGSAVLIGKAATTGSSIGAINIGAVQGGANNYEFRFDAYSANPKVGPAAPVAPTIAGVTSGGFTFFLA